MYRSDRTDIYPPLPSDPPLADEVIRGYVTHFAFTPRMLNYTFFREMTVGKTRFREKNRDFALKLKKNRDFGEKNCVGNRGWLRLKNAFSR